uniref:Protein kinase domain-containing protein n=1 Tax=Periophthalmus magnuspinnatus TaxID=409849 RepID=A0A3B3ZFE6_9GOBI
MAFHFCPQCGTKLQPDFKFCPACGEKLTCPEALGAIASTLSPSKTSVHKGPTLSPVCEPKAGKSKKTKAIPALEPLLEGTDVTDTNGKKWKLVRLLSHGAKDGKIFNEQNFLQRAAKPASSKWVKQHKMDFIGLPQCIGFGLHANSYRFLVFPNMGHSLQSLMNNQNTLLSEVTVLQLACRLLDILVYIHSNEYIHADINAENVYINQGQGSQVYLVGYNHAFRYCPGGHHVEYREGSRTPNEGAVESISLDCHSGAAPSRRSDLQSLGYCMLYWHTGTLPWTTLSQPEHIAAEKRRYDN